MKHRTSSSSFSRVRSHGVISSILSSRLLIPLMICVWFLYFTLARSQISKSLRGAATENVDSVDSSLQTATVSNEPIENLIVVAGHSVVKVGALSWADRYDSSWYLLSYQINQGFPAIITSHIKKGIELANRDRNAMLMFSGGQTRKDVGPTSEAASYYYLADIKNWMPSLKNRVYLEEFARDSFENLLFSVCRFREVQGYYPKKITVVGFDFKATRFTDLHRRSIGFPSSNFTYVGVQSPKAFNMVNAIAGEAAAIQSFNKDQYGCNDPELHAKRDKRNPFSRTVPYELSCPEIVDLLAWCGPTLFKDIAKLPWTQPPPQ